MKTVLLNISDFNNEWNRSVLDMSRRDREAARGIIAPAKRTAETTVRPQANPSPVSPDVKYPPKQ